jgi:hypothetical protein
MFEMQSSPLTLILSFLSAVVSLVWTRCRSVTYAMEMTYPLERLGHVQVRLRQLGGLCHLDPSTVAAVRSVRTALVLCCVWAHKLKPAIVTRALVRLPWSPTAWRVAPGELCCQVRTSLGPRSARLLEDWWFEANVSCANSSCAKVVRIAVVRKLCE